MNRKNIVIGFFLLLVFGISLPALAGRKVDRTIRQTAGSPNYTFMDINNASTVFRNNGTSDIDAQQANSGFVFPKGSGKACVFESGFLWGGLIAGAAPGDVQVGGSTYNTGLQGGKILPN